MLSIRVVILLSSMLVLAGCAGSEKTAGSLASTDAFVRQQLDRRGL